jgi:hypothetical protein
MSVIWPGLEVLIKSYVCHRDKKPVEYRYPFRLHPPDLGFNRGTYNGDLMERVLALYSHLHPKREVGGRVRLDAVQVRAAIFAVRVTSRCPSAAFSAWAFVLNFSVRTAPDRS